MAACAELNVENQLHESEAEPAPEPAPAALRPATRYSSTQQLAISALLIAVGIAIPTFSPFKIIIEPVASYTLASHVAIFVAMFVSPASAVAVAIGTTLGFVAGGFPAPIVARAASHVVWALGGALVLKRYPHILDKFAPALVFSVGVAIVHGIVELATVAVFYDLGLLSAGFYETGFWQAVVLLVGLGTVLHSMVDFAIASLVWRPIRAWRANAR